MAERKKVLYISYDGMTDPLGQSQVIPYLRGLTRQGYDFTILSFEKKERLAEKGAEIKKVLDQSGIQWHTRPFSHRIPLLSKMYDQWVMNRTVAALHRHNNYRLLHCRSYVAADAGTRLLKKYGIPFLFDMRGFWVDERVDSGQWDLKKSLYRFLYKRFKKKEKQYFATAGHVISLTHTGKKELAANYNVAEEKVTVIPCCADLHHFDARTVREEDRQEARKKLMLLPGDKVLTYLGSLGSWYLTDEMLDFFAAARKRVPGLKFLFITHNKKEEIKSKLDGRGIAAGDIIFQPAGRAQVPLFLSLSTWSIFFIRDAYSKKASSPTKQGEIMAMGIPLICNDIGDTGHIVQESRSGIVVGSLTPAGYEKVLDRLDELSGLSPEAIRKGAFEFFDLEKGILEYGNVYRKLLA